MKAVLFSFGRALASQFHPRMLLLTFLPFLVALGFWYVLLLQTLNPLISWVHHLFLDNDGFSAGAKWLAFVGLIALKAFIAPLISMWLLLPLMIVTSLVFVGVLATPISVRHVGRRYHPTLERRQGLGFLGLLWITLSSILLFALLWVLTLPLCALPIIGVMVQPLLWGWLTCRLIANEVLGIYADAAERDELMRQHRWPLLVIGTITGLLGMVPSMLWLCLAAVVILFPVLATLSIWLYVLVFLFSGLWFAHYCLAALAAHRHHRSMEAEVAIEEQAPNPGA